MPVAHEKVRKYSPLQREVGEGQMDTGLLLQTFFRKRGGGGLQLVEICVLIWKNMVNDLLLPCIDECNIQGCIHVYYFI